MLVSLWAKLSFISNVEMWQEQFKVVGSLAPSTFDNALLIAASNPLAQARKQQVDILISKTRRCKYYTLNIVYIEQHNLNYHG